MKWMWVRLISALHAFTPRVGEHNELSLSLFLSFTAAHTSKVQCTFYDDSSMFVCVCVCVCVSLWLFLCFDFFFFFFHMQVWVTLFLILCVGGCVFLYPGQNPMQALNYFSKQSIRSLRSAGNVLSKKPASTLCTVFSVFLF